MANVTAVLRAEDQITSVLQRVRSATQQTQKALDKLGTTNVVSANANESLNTYNDSVSKSPSLLSRFGSAAKKALAIVGGFTVVRGIFNTLTNSIGTALNRLDTFEVFERKMNLITGSSAEATYALNEMTNATKGTAYMLDTAAMAVQNFVTRGMDTKDATKSAEIWMDAVSAYGNGTNEQFESVIDAIAKMRTKGTVEMRYLNRLFAVGINPVKMYAQATGQSAEAVQEALSSKTIKTEEFLSVVEEAMRNGTNGVVKVEGMAKKVATTWSATLVNSRIALARGVADVIQAVDESFKVVNENGLRGLILDSANAMEAGLKKLSTAIRIVLPKIIEMVEPFVKFVINNAKPLAFSIGLVVTAAIGLDTWDRAVSRIEKFGKAWEKLSGIFQKAKVAEEITEVVEAEAVAVEYLDKVTPVADTPLALPGVTPQKQLEAKSPLKQIEYAERKALPSPQLMLPGEKRLALPEPISLDLPSDEIPEFAPKGLENPLAKVKMQYPATIPPVVFSDDNLPVPVPLKKQKEIAENVGTSKKKSNIFGNIASTAANFLNPTHKTGKEKIVDAVTDKKSWGAKGFAKTVASAVTGTFGLGKALIPEKAVEAVTDNKMVTGIKNFGTGVQGAFQTVGSGLKVGFTTMISDLSMLGSQFMGLLEKLFGSQVLDIFSSLFGGLLKSSLSFITAIPQIAAGVIAFSAVFGILGKINEDGEAANGVASFFKSITDNAIAFKDSASQAITNFVQGFIEKQPILVERGIELVNTVLIGLASSIPQLITTGATLVIKLVTGLIQCLPTLVSTGFQAIQGLIQGLGMALPILVQEGWKMILAIGDAIATNLPIIFESGKETIQNLVSGIKETLPMLLETGWNILVDFCHQFMDNLPQIIETGGRILTALVQGIAEMLPDLIMAGIDLITWLVTTIIEHFPEIVSAGINLVIYLGQGLISMLPFLGEQAGNLLGVIWNALVELGTRLKDKALEIGGNIINGLKEGVINTWETVKESVTDFGNQLIQGVKDKLGIASPSKEMIAIGGYVGEGFDNGLQEKMPIIINNMKASIDQMIAESRSKVDVMIADIEGLYAELQSRLQTQLDTMTSTLNERWQTMANECILIIARFNNELTGGLSDLLNETSSIWTNISTTMNQIIDRMSNQGQDLFKTMVDSLQQIMDKMPAYMHDIAVQFMTELHDGIVSETDKVTSATNTLVEKMKQTFLTGMGIHSPAKFGIYVADMIGLGLMKLDSDKVAQFYEYVVSLMQESFKNGKFNANELVNYLSDEETMTLIGKLSGVDTSALKSLTPQQIAYPLIGTMGTQTSWFGYRPPEDTGGIGTTNHGGVDLAAPEGTPIAAALAGTVASAGYSDGYGNLVVVAHGNGLESYYGHMSAITTQELAPVQKGQQIGLVGSTGNSTGPHLHFELRQNGNKIDPQPYLEGAGLVASGSAANPLVLEIQKALNAKHGITAVTTGSPSYNPSAGVSQWSNVVLQALAMLGQPASLLNDVLYAIESESSGNPNAINLSDSNAAMGDPSRGLLQTIGSTFMAYRNPSLSDNIFDPLANIYAALNYMIQAYGGIANVVNPRRSQWGGYAVGTRYVPEDMLAPIHKGEAIIPRTQNPYSQSGGNYLRDILGQALNNGALVNYTPYGGFDLSNFVEDGEATGFKLNLSDFENGSSTNNSNYDNRVINLNNNFTVSDERTGRMTAREIEQQLHEVLKMDMHGSRNI